MAVAVETNGQTTKRTRAEGRPRTTRVRTEKGQGMGHDRTERGQFTAEAAHSTSRTVAAGTHGAAVSSFGVVERRPRPRQRLPHASAADKEPRPASHPAVTCLGGWRTEGGAGAVYEGGGMGEHTDGGDNGRGGGHSTVTACGMV